MNSSGEGLKIGRVVKEFRHKKQITLHDLAAKTGIAKTVLDEIENGDVVPPVATLLKLARAFNVGMASFFEEEAADTKISVTRSGERVKIKRRPHHHHEGEIDYIYESLETHKGDKHMEPLLVEFQPVDTGDMVFTNHEGEEFLFVLEGRLEFRTDERVERLDPGDTIYFESEINHGLRSLDGKPAKALKGSKFIHIYASCPTGWRIPSEMSVKIARMAVQTNIFPLYEVEDGIKYTINYRPKEYLVREYFKLQGRFKHLTDRDLDQIQEMVNEDWELLLRKAAERV